MSAKGIRKLLFSGFATSREIFVPSLLLGLFLGLYVFISAGVFPNVSHIFDKGALEGAPHSPLPFSTTEPGERFVVRLLTPVYARVDGAPYPVVFALAGAITCPDGSSLDLGEARLIAAAQGSEVDARALFRLVALVVRNRSARSVSIKVDGWIVGEDRRRGMSGHLTEKPEHLILATTGVSFSAALMDHQNNNSPVDYDNPIKNIQEPNVTNSECDYAATALTDAVNRIRYRDYDSSVPVVEVLANHEATAIFSLPVNVRCLCENY